MSTARSEKRPPDNEDVCAWVEYLGGDVDAFRQRFGGRQLYIPHSAPASHRLCEALGTDVAGRLCHELGGVMTYVQTPQKSKVLARRMLVLILTWAGLGVNRIAEIGEFTSRRVSLIRADLRGAGFLPPADRAGNSQKNERY